MRESINDIDLLKDSLQGHAETFEVLVGRYQSLVCAITYGATGNVDKSEELAQETFLLAWKNLRQLKDLAKFKAWLCRIARSVIQNWWRARQHDVVSHAVPLEAASSQSAPDSLPVEVAIHQEQQGAVDQALECIPEQYRVPLILFYRENKSTREVAEVLDLSENTARQRISRARGLLKDQVAAMVETTLAQSKPGKAFTAAVVASLAGISIKGVATATAAAAVSTGISALAVKITAVAAGVLLVAGVTFMIVKHEKSNPTPPPIRTQGGAASPNETELAAVAPVEDPVSPDDRAEEAPQDNLAAVQAIANPSPASATATTPYEFRPTGILSGLITDAQTGQPVRDASLRISNNGIRGIRTDEHGFYHIDKIFRPGNCTIFIDSNDYVGFGLNANAPVLNLSQDQQVVKHFQLPRACKVEVWVVDANGMPIEGAEVIPTSLADSRRIAINDHGMPRHTDPNGHLLLGGFAPSPTDYMITALAKKTVRTRALGQGLMLAETQFTHCPSRALVCLTDPNVTTQVKIVLERGETIYGYAEYNDREPAEGIKIGVQPSWWHCMSSQDFCSVNPDGTFAISHIVPGTYNILMATTNADGLPISSKVIMQQALPLAEGGPFHIHLPIPSPQTSVSISGHFVFEGNGKPDGVMVTATSPDFGSKSMDFPLMPGSRTHEPFSLEGLEPGQYRLRFSGQYIEEKTFEDIAAPCIDLEVKLNTASYPRLDGFVVDEQTEEPIPHFRIRLRKTKTLRGSNSMPSREWITFNHNEGYFSLDTVGPGIYQVQALADGHAPCWSDPVNTDESQDVLIPLSRGGMMIGRIINQAGDPISDAKVLPLSWAAGTTPRTKDRFVNEDGATSTTEDGSFTLSRLPKGIETINVMHPDYTPKSVHAIEIKNHQTTYVDDIVLTSGGSVEGFVWDEQGHPLANQVLYFQDKGGYGGTADEEAGRLAMVVTDVNGFYQVSHLPIQLCYVNRAEPWKMTGVVRRTIIPREGESVRLDLGGPFRISGTLMNKESVLSQRRLVLAAPDRSPSAMFKCFTITDAFGHFTFSGIVPGTYQLAYENQESQPRWKTVTSVAVADDDLDLGVLDGAEDSSQTNRQSSATMPFGQVSSEPRMRCLALKLPLLQPRFHWTFVSKADFFAGKLVLRIKRADENNEIIVFENGRISENWQPMSIPNNPKAGEIYFGFESSQPYVTAPNDTLEIELHVAKNLDGIGALQTGILPAGIYKAQGTYSLITDEYQVPDVFKSMPAETIEKLKKAYEFKAFLESWQPQWPLQITGDEGWLEPEQRQLVERMLETMKNQQ